MRTFAFSSLCVSLFLSFAGSSGQAAPYLEAAGRVVVEAEHFEKRTTEKGGDHKYLVIPDEDPGNGGPFENARGGKFVQVLPEAGQNKNADESVVGTDPYIEYAVQITTLGEYQLYLRVTGYDGGADSMYAQIMEIPSPKWYRYSPDPNTADFAAVRNDNADAATAIGWNGYATPEVVSGDGGEEKALFQITKAGTYTIRLSQREDSNAIDAIILQLSSLPPPTNPGPGESALAGSFVRISEDVKDVIVALNTPATFKVVADGSPAVTYQWQKAAPGSSTFADVAGATSANYTSGALGTADNGAKYRVNVSVPGKTATSRDALLTVDTQAPTIASVTGSDSFTTATIVFAEPVTADAAGNKANYSADGGLTISDVKVITPTTVRLTTSKQTSGTKYNVSAKSIKDLVGNVSAEAKGSFTGFVLGLGVLKFEAYSAIIGTPVDNLISDPKYPNSPDEIGYVTSFDTRTIYPTDAHENYGASISGWLVPTETAQYELFLRSDDASQLFFSTDDKPANAALVAEETGCCDAYHESGDPETSAPISLTAGKRYFIQVLYKEGGGGDYAQVAWRKVGDTTGAGSLTPIPGKFLQAYVSPDATLSITQQPASVTTAGGSQVSFSVRFTAKSYLGSGANVQWQKNGVDIPGATSQDYLIPFASAADNGAKYHAVVSVGTFASSTSSDAVLNITVDKTPPALVKVNGTTKTVRLSFSEPLDAASGADKANYTIDKGATISAVKIVSAAGAAAIVQLDIAGATAGTVYNVAVKNVKDQASNPVAANAGGGFIAYNAFYDFDDGAFPAGTTAYGPAAILPNRGFNGGSALMLTPSVGSQQGGFLIPDLVNGAPVTKFTVQFKLFIGEGSGNPADGFSFSFAPDVPEATVGEEGAGSGITVSLDTYDNGGGEAPAVDVKYGGTEVDTKKVTKITLVNNKYVDVTIQLNAGGTISVSHNTTNYYAKLALPGFAPISGGKILIGARTGGEREIHLVDDFAILINADLPTEIPKGPDVPAPTVAITSPANGAAFPSGVSATITATATANGGRTISKVEFFSGTSKLGESATAPYSITIPAIPDGRYTLTAVATDNQGSSTTSAVVSVIVGSPPEIITLFTFTDSTVWNYNRSGIDLGTAWKDVKFDDSKWEKGVQPIGDNADNSELVPIRTKISRNNDAGDHITTLYVRGHFNFSKTSTAGVTLSFKNMVDDGAVFYLNGVEVRRFGIAAGAVTYDTFAAGHEASTYDGPISIAASALSPGDNVFAIEVHQSDATSSDIVFGVELIATVPSGAVVPPPTTGGKFSAPVVQGGNLVLTWTGTGTLQSADAVTGPWADVASAKSPFTAARAGAVKFYRLK